MKKIIVFGNQQIALDCIKILINIKDVNLLAVVGCKTKQDISVGYPSIKEYCARNNILYYNPEKLDENFLKVIKILKPDLCFSIFSKKYFSQNYLSMPPMGFINVHASLLPKYRGPTPVIWALVNNEDKVGITLHYLDKEIDTGDIIGQSEIKVPKNISGYDLKPIITKKGVQLFKRELPLILKGTNKRVKQNHANATYYGQYSSELKIINWFLPVKNISRQVQALTKPYDGTKAFILDKELLIWKAKVIRYSKKKLSGPGKIIKVYTDGKFIVSGVDGHLLIEDYQWLSALENEPSKYIKVGNKFKLY